MMTEVDELRARLDEVEAELTAARERMEEMQRRSAPRRPNKKLVAGVVVGLLALLSLGLYAQVGPTPLITTPEGLLLNLTRRVTALEREVTALQRETAAVKQNRETEATGQRVTAPFEVVDDAGVPIFRVVGGVRGAAIFDAEGTPRISFWPWNESGEIAVSNERGERAVLGPGSGGQMTLQFNIGDTRVAGIGVLANAQGGGIVVADASAGLTRGALYVDESSSGRVDIYGPVAGPARASLKVDDGRGVAAVYNQSGIPIATLFEDPDIAGTGRLWVTDAQGNAAFRAGWVPGDLGSACVNRKNGVWCVGINIPLGIGAGGGGR